MGYIAKVCTDEEWRRYAAGWCPRCLGFCTCRACMRKPHPREQYSAPEHQVEEYARHVLRYVGPLLADQHAHKVAEVQDTRTPSLSLTSSVIYKHLGTFSRVNFSSWCFR